MAASLAELVIPFLIGKMGFWKKSFDFLQTFSILAKDYLPDDLLQNVMHSILSTQFEFFSAT
jgi:asparagine N-glycosylation enzyme membrane subunit Stt3